MRAAERSLRWAVQTWLSPTAERPVRVTQCRRTVQRGPRYVCVEAPRTRGILSIFFFRHEDDSWHVFPPEATRPAMKWYHGSA